MAKCVQMARCMWRVGEVVDFEVGYFSIRPIVYYPLRRYATRFLRRHGVRR